MSNSQSHRNCSGTAGENTHCCPPRFAACESAEADLHPAAGAAILQCGEVVDPLKIPANFTGLQTLAAVEIDATCLCYPHVKIEFSTLIDIVIPTTATSGVQGKLDIQLSRTCNGGLKKTLQSYTINVATPGAGGTITIPWSFIFCEDDLKSKKCIYSVDILKNTLSDGAATPTGVDATFNSTDIAAFAVGGARIC